jgi:hypothetical protein
MDTRLDLLAWLFNGVVSLTALTVSAIILMFLANGVIGALDACLDWLAGKRLT